MEIEQVMAALRKKGYAVSYFSDKTQAAEYLNQQVDNKTVGFGDSETLNSLKLYELLAAHNQVVDPQHPQPNKTFHETAKECLTTDVFFTSVNAMAQTGELVNIDGTGNRVAGSLFGHEKVYFVVGTNKIMPTVEDAVWRARNVAAPQNAARHHYKTPCAVKGDRCYDCSSPDRICCGLMVHYQKMRFIEMEVVLIDEPLGF